MKAKEVNKPISLAIFFVALMICTQISSGEVFTIDTKDYPTFNSAVDAMGYVAGTLGVSNASKVTSDITVASNITLVFVKGGYIDMNSGVTVNINGPVDAVCRRIFAGDGQIYFGDGRVAEIYPQWWGAAGDGKYDDTEAIQKMVITAAASEMLCRFPQGYYKITDTISFEATHGLQWRMPPGAFIDAQHNNPQSPYALYLKNCINVDLEVNIKVKHPKQGGILVYGQEKRNSCYNKIKGFIQGPGRSLRKPPIAGGSIGLRLAMDGSCNFFNDFNVRIFGFDTCISLQDGCNANRFINPQLEKFWYGIELSSDENFVLGGFCHFAPGSGNDIVDCIYVGYHATDKEDASASYNQVIGMVCETGPKSRTLNIQNGGANVFMIQNNNSVGDIIKRPDNHIFLKDKSFTVSAEITDGLKISTRDDRGTPIQLHLSQTCDLFFPKPAKVPGSSDLTIKMAGVEVGDTVVFAPGNSIPFNCQITAWVDKIDTVKVRLLQYAGKPKIFNAGTCRVDVWKH